MTPSPHGVRRAAGPTRRAPVRVFLALGGRGAHHGGGLLGGVAPREADCCPVCLRQCAPHAAERLTIGRLDPAPAQVAQRVPMPEHVLLGWLPAYRPEGNPGERLGEDLQARIDGLDEQGRSRRTTWQAPVAALLRRSTAETIASLTSYASLGEATRAL
jgi:hypothetical protein